MESCQQEAGRTGAHTGFSLGSHSQSPAGLTGSCDLRPSAEKSLFWQSDKGASLVRCDLQAASLCGAPRPVQQGSTRPCQKCLGSPGCPQSPFFLVDPMCQELQPRGWHSQALGFSGVLWPTLAVVRSSPAVLQQRSQIQQLGTARTWPPPDTAHPSSPQNKTLVLAASDQHFPSRAPQNVETEQNITWTCCPWLCSAEFPSGELCSKPFCEPGRARPSPCLPTWDTYRGGWQGVATQLAHWLANGEGKAGKFLPVSPG